MKTDNYFSIKLKVERIVIAGLLLFTIIFLIMLVRQNSEIRQLKSEVSTQQRLTQYLDSRIDELEDQKSDLESKIDDIEGRVGDLESNSNY